VGEREQTLARIWQQLFGLERVGRNDNFFDIGGNSIRAIQTVTQANKAGLEIKIGNIFKLQTIQAICGAVEAAAVAEAAPAVRDAAVGALSPYQRSVIDAGAAAAGCWHTQVEIGSGLTETHFRHLLKELLGKHASLLAVEIERDASGVKPVEVTRELLRTMVEAHDVSGMQAHAIAARVDATRTRQDEALSVLEGPLLRASLFVGDTSSSALLSVHRVLLDQEQWEMVSGEFRGACAGAMQ
jgi:hypothetical protein